MTDDDFHEAFDYLRSLFTHRTKKVFLDDLEALFEDQPNIKDLVCKRDGTERHMAVSFDRRLKDTDFSYGYFDILLQVLAFLASGHFRIHKPVNQVRVLLWNGSDLDLITVVRAVAPRLPQLNYRRVMAIPIHWPPEGHKLDLA